MKSLAVLLLCTLLVPVSAMAQKGYVRENLGEEPQNEDCECSGSRDSDQAGAIKRSMDKK